MPLEKASPLARQMIRSGGHFNLPFPVLPRPSVSDPSLREEKTSFRERRAKQKQRIKEAKVP